MTTTVTAKIQLRKGTAAQWTSANPTLLSGELGYETDTGKQKVGDGTTAWTSLAYYHDPDLTSDHGGLSGLADDDHSQYHTDARGDARYTAIAHATNTSNPHSVTAVQVGADASGTAAGLLNGHELAVNPHPGYLTPAEGDAAYEPIGSTNTHSNVLTTHGISTFGATLVDDLNASAARTTLELGTAATTAASDYAVAAKGVTNGDSHDHSGGDGAQIAYSGLSGLPTLGTAAAADSTAYATAAQGSKADTAVQLYNATAVVYVSADGLDTNNGLDRSLSKLTLSSALTQAAALIVAGADGVRIDVMDGGTYTEAANLSIPTGVHVIAPSAVYVGTVSIAAKATFIIGEHYASANSQSMVTHLAGNDGPAIYHANICDGRGLSGTLTSVDNILNGVGSGKNLFVRVGILYVAASGEGVRDTLSGTSHIHATISDLYLAGSNAQGIVANSSTSSIIGYVDHILEVGTPSGTIAIRGNVSGGVIRLTANEITADTAYSMTGGSALYLTCPRIIGTRTGTPAQLMLGTADDAADLGSGAATDGHVLTADGAGGAAWEAVPDAYAGAASEIHAATEKTTPVDADELGLSDSAASWGLKKLTWAKLVTRLKVALTYFNDGSNVSLGSNLFANLTTGITNSFFGSSSGAYNTDGTYNTFLGANAGFYNSTGSYNSFIGRDSGRSNTTASSNTAVGRDSGRSTTTGATNTFLGVNAGYSNTTGASNIFFGVNSGRYHANGSTVLTDPDYSVYIGTNARGKDNDDNNSVVIGGNTPIGLGANTTVIGTSATTLTRLYGNLGLGVDSPSAAIHTIKTTEQLRLGYDATYYASFTVNSVGALTQQAVGGQTLIGGTGVADKLLIKGTSGNGIATAVAFEVDVGNNGNLAALTIANNGQLIIQGDATTDLPVYGSELLTSAGWTVNTGWTESPDDFFAHSSGTGTLTHSAAITSGWKLQIAWTITGRTAGSVTIAVGGQSLASQTATGSFGPTATSTAAFTITPTTDFNGTLSLVSMKQITSTSTPIVKALDSVGSTVFEIRKASNSVFIGTASGGNNTSGIQNTAVGGNTALRNTTGSYNSSYGMDSFYSNTVGSYNSAFGYFSLNSNISGTYNNAIGAYALRYNTTGNLNCAMGRDALLQNTTGSFNAGVGPSSLHNNTTGSYNTGIGPYAGRFQLDGTTALTDPEYSVYIGAYARGKDNSDSNSVVIGGNTPIGLGANTTVIGTSATTLTRLYGNLGLGVDSPSAALHAVKTTEQLRLGYDATYYASFTVSSAGNLTITPAGGTLNIGALNATSILTQSQILSAASFGAL